jgi:hypothetical protein
VARPSGSDPERRSPAAPLLGSPLRDGLAALLVLLLAVALTWKVDQELPFEPTYELGALLPGAANLREAGEVRAGGFRIGTVDAVEPRMVDGRAVALVRMRLGSIVDPLPATPGCSCAHATSVASSTWS